ncbi:MAG: hypothetical protein JOY77_06875, partial [Alphaproteobacteria bacterium]|nr:hypothetical protein [Alphaproteobacteria bacterium]
APDRAPVILSAPSGGNLSGFEVIGTAIAGNVSAALIRNAVGQVIRVKPDSVVQGWRLVSIDRTQIVFDRDGERRTLTVVAAAPRPGSVTTQLGAPGTTSSDDDDNSSSSSDDDDDDN